MRRLFANTAAVFTLIASTMVPSNAQESLRKAAEKADALRLEYRFQEAAEICDEALGAGTMDSTLAGIDKALLERLEAVQMLSRNGENMLRYASRPTVVAKKQLSLEEFFLWYPFEEGSWRQGPNAFDSSDAFPFATHMPEGAGELYFSAHDEDGVLSIYHSERADSLWSAPVLADEKLTSGGNEVFPVLSADGKSLWFASDGLYGAGGYDLYVSRWNSREKAWDEPENLGFPYSSPYNDYLFMNSPDGRWSLFASDRECPGTDSVWVYVLEFDSMPVRHAITDPAEALALSRLMVDGSGNMASEGTADDASASSAASGKTGAYARQLRKVLSLKDDIETRQKAVDAARARLSRLDSDGQKELADEIMEKELAILSVRDALNKATGELQDMEMDLIAEGVAVDPHSVLGASGSASGNASSSSFAFTRHSFGKNPQIAFAKPVSSFDYSFMVLPVGRFAEDNTLPDGLIYQIQIFSKTSGTAKESDLKGLSPVFSHKDKSGKTIYCAGLFHSYNDCLSALNKVKRAGFKSAMIVAFRDGASISISAARQAEKTLVQSYSIHITPEGGRLSEAALSAINSATSKDLVRETDNGTVTYILGSWSDIEEASTVLSTLKAAGISSATLETVSQ